MIKRLLGTTVVLGMTLIVALGAAWAEAKVTVTREESKPSVVEIQAGESVWFVNSSGGLAHVSFGEKSPIQFMVGTGNSSVNFTEPGTYRYYVHISGVKAHAHTGTIVVK
jgi:plastocyanin